MIADQVERKMMFNENDSRSMSSLWFTVNKKNETKDSHLLTFLFQNTFTGNVAIDIYGGRYFLTWQQCSEKLSVEYTIKLPYKVM